MRCFLAALSLALASPAATGTCLAQDGPTIDADGNMIFPVGPQIAPIPPGSLLLFFQGGTADRNVAAALEVVASEPGALPVEAHMVAAGETVCGLLIKRGFPVGCAAYQPLLSRLNGGKALDALTIGQSVNLPDLQISTARSVRAEPVASKGLIRKILDSWRAFKPSVREDADRTRIDFDRFELRLQAADPEQLGRLQRRLVERALANVAIEIVPFEARVASGHSATTPADPVGCVDAALTGAPVNYSSYALEDDPSPTPVLPGSAVRTKVILVDVPIQTPPNLREEKAPQGWPCKWVPFEPRFHATHLAGIVGSRANGYGFVGLAPHSRPIGLPYRKADPGVDATVQLLDGELLNNVSLKFQFPESISSGENETAPVFLIASSFYDEKVPFAHAASPDARFNGANATVASAIRNGGGLFIISAGQSQQPLELSATAPLSPQNLGDLENVVVVTACTKCTRTGGRLMDGANYDKQRLFVQLAAPGGKPLAGWVSPDSIGAAPGTSQAAAYVAGVAADMIQRYPQTYRSAWSVKLRLQVTSAPLRETDGALGADGRLLAAGLVDPRVAVLDPTKDWIRRGGDWEEVRIRGWANPQQRFRNVGIASYDLSNVPRFSQAGKRYLLYPKVTDPNGNVMRAAVRIQDVGVLVVTSGNEPALQLCSGDPVRLADIDEYLPRLNLPSTQELSCSAD